MERRKCFGTKECSPNSGICRNCPWLNECKDVEPKQNGNIRKKILHKQSFGGKIYSEK